MYVVLVRTACYGRPVLVLGFPDAGTFKLHGDSDDVLLYDIQDFLQIGTLAASQTAMVIPSYPPDITWGPGLMIGEARETGSDILAHTLIIFCCSGVLISLV